MKKEEKELIYNLLKTASSNIQGYVSESFKTKPEFTDDSVSAGSTDLTGSTVSQNISSNISEISDEEHSSLINQNAPQNPVDENIQKVQLPEQNIDREKLTLDSIAAKVARCTRCSLARTRNNVVPGMGVLNPDVLVIGEGPGYDEDQQGLPFVGKAGILLDKMLSAIHLDRKTNCYIANIVKCRPPQNRDPYPQEMDACFSFLEAQINILKPKMILCMGKISSNKLLNTDSPIGRLRGTFYEYNNIPVLVTYHPSALLRNEELKKPAWEDLKQFRAKLDSILGNEVSTNNS